MVVISGLGTVPAPRPGPRRAGGAGFLVPEDGSAAVATAAPLSACSLLGLQEAEQDAVRDREARKHGQAVLEALRAVQLGLLSDSGMGAAALEVLAKRVPDAADPALAGVQRALLLRAAVERARAAASR